MLSLIHLSMEEERRFVRKALRARSRFFKYYDRRFLDAFVHFMTRTKYSSKQVIMTPEDAPQNLYVLVKGKASITNDVGQKEYLYVGAVYGEQEILAKLYRSATMTAETECIVWQLNRYDFKLAVRKMNYVPKNKKFLRSIAMFRNYSEEMLDKIEEELEVAYFDTDDIIPLTTDNIQIVSSGHLKLIEKESGEIDAKKIGRKIVKIFKKGDCFDDGIEGELSAFFPGSECIRIRKDVLSEFKDNDEVNCQKKKNVGEIVEDEEYGNIELEDLDPVTIIGTGSYGTVSLVRYTKASNVSFALKKIEKAGMVRRNQQDHSLNERELLMTIKSPFITRCYRTFRDDRYVYFLSEVCLGGDIMRILGRYIYFDEDVARFICACVVEALEYLHNRQIMYRDLKPENLVIDRNGYIKLTDLGLSKYVGYTGKSYSFCGTYPYFTPENVLNTGADHGVDFWTLGVLIYELVTGELLFGEENRLQVYDAILGGVEQVFFSGIIRGSSSEDLVKKLCVREPSKRIGYRDMNEIKTHRWFQDFDWNGLKSLSLPAPKILIPLLRDSFDPTHFDSFEIQEEIPRKEVSNWDYEF
ncbi:cAMP-dependent protein kinase catalytic subunit beta-like isoform X3 [Harmonia axyridis]|uniref:cAMP-dependent protein kinase catalytic subunit beta-like isoform X3 n=1 Tax=Harmonia axyridis TaxID=115357 RepID=UPI001E2777AD|nr:cAMP-dependent protein kinase catalytic subunit beta-like isoform X3 [Harmonia axyridis]